MKATEADPVLEEEAPTEEAQYIWYEMWIAWELQLRLLSTLSQVHNHMTAAE